MTALLFSLIGLAWALGLGLYGVFSFVTAGVFCFTVYSVPALLGLVYPFHLTPAKLALSPASSEALHATLVAWVFFCATLALRLPQRFLPKNEEPREKGAQLDAFVTAAIALCLLGYLAIAVTDGPLFFMDPRDEQGTGTIRLLWRWVNAMGLGAALLARRREATPVFLAAMLCYFLAGDRSVAVITGFALFSLWGQGKPSGVLLQPRLLVPVALVLAVAVLGKPIYLAVKGGSLDALTQALTEEGFQLLFDTFEPFLTYNTLNLVVTHDFQVSGWRLMESVAGQFLLIPSALDIDANRFNAEFTSAFASHLSYGIAGNYWAQGWALGGAVAVAAYAFLFGAALRLCDRAVRTGRGVGRLFAAFVGALFAAYLHRNALDNLLSFVRQLALVSVLAWICSLALRAEILSMGRRARRTNPSAPSESGREGTVRA